MHVNKRITNPWIIWFPAALFYCYQFILRVSPSVMTFDLMRDFGLTAGGVGALAAFYYYGYCIMQIPIGILMDYFGPRKLLTCAVLLCSISTSIFANTTDLYFAQFGRFLMGVGSSCAFLGCMKLGTVWFDAKKLPMLTGITMIFGVLGANFGGMPLCLLSNFYDWRISLLIVSGFGILIAIGIWVIDPEGHSNPNQSGEISLFSGLKLVMSNPQVWLGSIYGFMIYLPLSVFADMWGVSFLSHLYNVTPEAAALYLTPVYIGWAIGALLYAFVIKKMITITTGLKITSLSTFILFCVILFIPNIPANVMSFLLFILGIVIGGQSLTFSLNCSYLPVQVSGVTLGFTNMMCMLSGVIFQPVVGMILDYLWKGEIKENVHVFYASDFRIALSVIPICVMISFVVTFFIKEKAQSNI